MADGSLSLQNGYVHVTLHKLFETYSYLTVVPAAKPDEDSMWNSQTPYCNYTTFNQGVPTTEGVVISLKKMEFVTGTPNGGGTKAIKAEYDLLVPQSCRRTGDGLLRDRAAQGERAYGEGGHLGRADDRRQH